MEHVMWSERMVLQRNYGKNMAYECLVIGPQVKKRRAAVDGVVQVRGLHSRNLLTLQAAG
jgi:hypothetical protein